MFLKSEIKKQTLARKQRIFAEKYNVDIPEISPERLVELKQRDENKGEKENDAKVQ